MDFKQLVFFLSLCSMFSRANRICPFDFIHILAS